MSALRNAAAFAVVCVTSAVIAALAVPTCLLAGALTVLWKCADWLLERIGGT